MQMKRMLHVFLGLALLSLTATAVFADPLAAGGESPRPETGRNLIVGDTEFLCAFRIRVCGRGGADIGI